MKNAKLIIGIISMVLFLLVALQSCAAGAANALTDNGEVSGTAGFILALCMLAAGIIAVATKNSVKRGGPIASAIIYAFGGLMGIASAGSYTDLIIWSVLSFAFAAVFVIFAVRTKPEQEEKPVDN